MRRILTALVLTSLTSLNLIQAQDIDAAINAYADKFSSERIYIHYDKSSYSPGETIWYKAYLMNEFSPADKSKTLYTDWVDDNGKLLHHAVSPIVDAVTNGQFDIPAEYKGKYILVRSYTKWMLNFDSAFLYSRVIKILSNEQGKPSLPAPPVATIRFFPEGGDAVAGVINKIAFKANDQYGRPVRVRGIIIDNKGKFIDSLRSMHQGMGHFVLMPEAGNSYSAKWKDEKSVERTTPLPAVKSGGVSMQISVAGTNRYLTINYLQGPSLPDTLHIVGTMYQHHAFRFTRPTNTPVIKATIPTAELPSGILTITVFDNKWQPLAERITYVNNQEYLFQPEMEVQHWGLNKRARNEIRIKVPDSLVASLSVSVTDAGIGSDSSRNIVSELFLSSELKGEVYNPAYYFTGNHDTLSRQLDLVMLTHGWRRFKWPEVFAAKTPKLKFERDTAYMALSGKLFGVVPSQITPGATIILVVKKEKDGKFLFLPIQPNGSFSDPEFILFDTANVYYQFQKNSGLGNASVQFMPDRLPAPSVLSPSERQYNFWPDTTGFYRHWALVNEANEMAEKFRVKTLEAVILKSKSKSAIQLMDEKYTSGLFQGDGIQFDMVNDPFAASAIDIFTYLQGKVAGLQINTSAGTPTLNWRGGAPQLYLDEIAADAEFISSVNVRDVAYIKVFRPPFMGGFNGANGAIAIYTRRGGDVRSEPGKGMSNSKILGYTSIREFYSPNYSSFRPTNEQRDLRTTLYWNPIVLATPQKREVVITFYNNDVSNAFRVVIEGMTRDGRLAHLEQIME